MPDKSLLAPSGYEDIVRYFGDPKFDGGRVDPKWERENMILTRSLPGVPKLYVHKKILEPLRTALQRCQDELGWSPRTIGCFAPRKKRASTELSVHAFGAAIDLDASRNPLQVNCPIGDPRRSNFELPNAVIEIWKAEGWFWGGDFKTRFDPMHFQWATGY